VLSFLGIGAQKAGTTWLFEQLRKHPQVRFPAGKELHFWNEPGERTLEWYRSLFEDPDPAIRQGEITPAYAILPVDTIREIGRQFPDLRLIYLLRNPIERAWSSALMALKRAELTIDEASDAWFVDHFRSRGSMMRGDYEQCIRNWLTVFPREQLLLRQFELIKANPKALLIACSRHIGVDEVHWSQEDMTSVGRPVFRGSRAPLRASLVPVLADIYADKIRRLADYLDWDLDAWLPSDLAATPARSGGMAGGPVFR
jgi:hypothetical protein